MTETIEETNQNETQQKATWGNIDEHTSMRAMELKRIMNKDDTIH